LEILINSNYESFVYDLKVQVEFEIAIYAGPLKVPMNARMINAISATTDITSLNLWSHFFTCSFNLILLACSSSFLEHCCYLQR